MRVIWKSRSLRLAAQDVALSRRKQGFESLGSAKLAFETPLVFSPYAFLRQFPRWTKVCRALASRLRRQTAGRLPSGELRRCRASVPGEPLSFGTIADQAAQRLRQRGHIVRRHQQAGARRHRVGDRSRHGGHDRQPVRDRLRKRHPIPLETRREHEYVGCQTQFDDTLRSDGTSTAILSPRPWAEMSASSRAAAARLRVRSPAMVSRQGRSEIEASAAISRSYPLSGTTDPIERSRTTASSLPHAGGTGSLPGRTTLMR